MSDRFIQNKLAFVTLLSACGIILVSMGLRQTFGLFFSVFEEALSVSRTEFGLAIGIQMFFWGLMAQSLDYLQINLEVIKQFFWAF